MQLANQENMRISLYLITEFEQMRRDGATPWGCINAGHPLFAFLFY